MHHRDAVGSSVTRITHQISQNVTKITNEYCNFVRPDTPFVRLLAQNGIRAVT
jgi:hypothetical protein